MRKSLSFGVDGVVVLPTATLLTEWTPERWEPEVIQKSGSGKLGSAFARMVGDSDSGTIEANVLYQSLRILEVRFVCQISESPTIRPLAPVNTTREQ